MRKSLRFQSGLMLLFHVILLLLLIWTAAVPLEQIQNFATDNIGEIGNRVAFQGNLVQMAILIWSAIVFTSVIGFVFPWVISRWVQNPILSIRNTIRQVCRGDLDSRVQVNAGKEIDALAFELNRMMEHQQQEHERLMDLNLTLSAVSACRHEMIHQTNEKRLLQECCRIFVDIGSYRMAWIGYAEDDSGKIVTPEALAGYLNGGMNTVSASWAETACSPSARAIRNRHPAIISNVFGDPMFSPLEAEATRHGYASILALPLSVNEQLPGSLTLYAEKTNAFGSEDVRIMTELADDLSYRIKAIRYAGN